MLAELIFGGSRKLSAHAEGSLGEFLFGPYVPPVAAQVTVNQKTALTYSAVWAATRLLAGTSGALPLNLFKRRPGGGQDIQRQDRRQRLVHSRPNKEMTSMLFRSSQFAFQINGGNCYSEIQRVGNMVVALWPIHPRRVTVKRDDDTGGLIYEVKNDNGAPPSLIPAKDILHMPSMMSPDGISGMGVIQHARESIGYGIATEAYGASNFGSGAIPRVVITHPQKLSDEARTNFRKDWKLLHSGPRGDKMAMLAEGAEVVPLNLSQKDNQFIETRAYNVIEIARWYGVPPHMIQSLDKATFSNIDAQGIEFVVYALIQWLKIWEQELWAKLITEAEQDSLFFEFNVNALLRGDSDARSKLYQTLVTLGILTVNEVRELESFNPVLGGDTRYMQGAMMPVGPDGLLIPPVQPEQPAAEPKTDDTDDLMARIDDYSLTTEESIAQLRGDIEMSATTNNGEVEKLREELETVSRGTDQREQMMKVAARQLLGGATRRIIRQHAQAARAAANDPDCFLEWNDGFSGKIEEKWLRELAPCISAFRAIGIEANAGTIVSEHLTTAREELLHASGVPPDKFTASIENIVSNWEEGRAQAMADSVYQLTIGE